jgi:hypothetical protein
MKPGHTTGLVVAMQRGRSFPQLRCQRCGTTITKSTLGAVVYAPTEAMGEESVWPIVILCKMNHCTMAPEYAHWLWMELNEFVLHLLAGLGITDQRQVVRFWNDAKEAADSGP